MIDYIFFKYIHISYLNTIENPEYRKQRSDGHIIRYRAFDLSYNDDTTTNVYNVFLEKKYYHDLIIPDNNQNLKAPIILFGDSYTWLHYDKGLQKLLAEYTSRPVFNFSFWCWGTAHMYYLSQKELLYKIIMDDSSKIYFSSTPIQPQYVIYTYIRDHRNRLFSVKDYFIDFSPYLTYEKINDRLVIKKYSIFQKLLFRSFIYRYFTDKYKKLDDDFAYDMIYNLIIETKKELQKHYPNIKFVVLEYYQEKNYIEQENNMFEKLRKAGVIVISTKDLTNEDLLNPKYVEPDGWHPNPYAWELLVPLFVNKLFNTD